MILHIWHHMGTPDAETHRRLMVARESRENEYRAAPGKWMAPALTFTRDSRDVGDEVPVPFVRDMIAQGMAFVRYPTDIIFLTNADVGFVAGITKRLHDMVNSARSNGAVHMRRRELARVDSPPTLEQIQKGDEYVGMDGCAFTARWWKKRAALFPDMILGRYGWDSAMRNLIRRSRGIEMKDELWHESHEAYWNKTTDDITYNRANQYNRALLHEWIAQYGGDPEDHLLSRKELNYK